MRQKKQVLIILKFTQLQMGGMHHLQELRDIYLIVKMNLVRLEFGLLLLLVGIMPWIETADGIEVS